MKTLYIVLTFCTGLLLGYLVFPSHKQKEISSTERIRQTEKRLDTIDTTKLAGEVELQAKNEELKERLSLTNSLLLAKTNELALERIRQDQLMHEVAVRPDSMNVDSLRTELSFGNLTTDSIFEEYHQKDSLNTRMVAVRDSQLIICNKAYSDARSLIRDQELRELQLTNDLNTALKENRKMRFKNRILSAGIFFTGGLITSIYLKTK